jgi:hypothetical protein
LQNTATTEHHMTTLPRPEPTTKPVLVGEANPYGGDPFYALYPAPDGSSGHRLCCLVLRMHRINYLRAFDRRNLCPQNWSAIEAKREARRLVRDIRPTKFVLLGQKVAHAFDCRCDLLSTWAVGEHQQHRALILPHPSGRCRAWSRPEFFSKAREAVRGFCPEVAHLLDGLDLPKLQLGITEPETEVEL